MSQGECEREKVSGMSGMEEMRSVHLMNLLKEADGGRERCVKSSPCVKCACVCTCVCLMLESCKGAAGVGCPLRTTTAL